MDDVYAGYYDQPSPYAERLADFIIAEAHETGRPVQEVWRETELVASQSLVSCGEATE
jgi:hypothetical protein